MYVCIIACSLATELASHGRFPMCGLGLKTSLASLTAPVNTVFQWVYYDGNRVAYLHVVAP